jgi:hypothetical protein
MDVLRRTRSFHVGVLTVMAAGLIGGCSSAAQKVVSPAPQVVSPTPQPATPADSCRGDQLTIQVKPLPGAASGRQYDDVVLTDVSRTPCSVSGSVKLLVTDAAHHAITVPVTTPDSGPTVALNPGGSATQTLLYGSDGNPAPGHSTCEPPEAFFEITAPGGTSPVFVPASGRGACPADLMSLSTLVAGTYSPPF